MPTGFAPKTTVSWLVAGERAFAIWTVQRIDTRASLSLQSSFQSRLFVLNVSGSAGRDNPTLPQHRHFWTVSFDLAEIIQVHDVMDNSWNHETGGWRKWCEATVSESVSHAKVISFEFDDTRDVAWNQISFRDARIINATTDTGKRTTIIKLGPNSQS